MQVDVWVPSYIYRCCSYSLTSHAILVFPNTSSIFVTYLSTKENMAEANVTEVAKGILGNLIRLVTDQIGLAWGFKDELTPLRESIETVQAVLADAEKRQVREESVRLWLQRLEDVAYDADDVLDEIA